MPNLTAAETCSRLRSNLNRVIIGKSDAIDLVIAALLAKGHLLIQDVPGLGKTLLARALAKSIAAPFQRIQFTPDLLPSDLTGAAIFHEEKREFEFRPGPVFTSILLADELNRATPRTQSALLEAMEERQVSVDGKTHPLPAPFFVLATQNPVEQQGVYDLPEAQLDRFLMQISIGYPSAEDEVRIIRSQLQDQPLDSIGAVATVDEITYAQSEATRVHIDDTLVEYAVRLAEGTRRHPELLLGASPRASLSLTRAAQAFALAAAQDYVLPDVIKRLAPPVFAHRMIVKPQAALGGKTAEHIVRELLDRIELPLETH